MAQPADLVSLDTFVHKEEKQPGCQADGMTNAPESSIPRKLYELSYRPKRIIPEGRKRNSVLISRQIRPGI